MEERSILLSRIFTPVVGALVLLGLFLISLYNYLLFHSLAEMFSIIVACGIFMVAWNARRFLDNNYLLFLGVAYLFIASLDLVHTLAYKGMGVFPKYDANLPTQLWISARYLESLSLLAAPLFLRRKLRMRFVLLTYAVVVSFLLGSIFYWQVFPDCFVEGMGLTPFKRISEYIISLILLASIALLLINHEKFDRSVLRLLILSIIVTVGAEVAFTFYFSVYSLANLIGHFLKIISFYLIYKAIIETGLVKPYKLMFWNLKQSEEELRERNEDLDAFAHTVAHDLKNPLALIIGSVRMLDAYYTTLTDEEVRERLHATVNMAFKMNNIIDELLLLARVRKAEATVEPLDMAAIVAEAQNRLAHLVETEQAEITLPDTWPVAIGYGPWIEEVWANYISNAIKHGGQPPRLELGATTLPDGMVRFWVCDNGPGITPENQKRLFVPFTRLEQVRATGHGLGLSIVRRIVEKLGGQVGVESEPAQGSLFFFTLPGVS